MTGATDVNAATEISSRTPVFLYRHPLWVRITHQINACVVILLVISGMLIAETYAKFHWGDSGNCYDDPAFRIPNFTPDQVFFSMCGGYSLKKLPVIDDVVQWFYNYPGYNDFTTFFTLLHINLAWLFLLNGVVYLWLLVSRGRLRHRLKMTRSELSPTQLARGVAQHARFRFSHGEQYNALQKLAYLTVIFINFPLAWLTGLAQSPPMIAAYPWLAEIFGGRMSARTIHYFNAWFIVLFIVVHVVMVLVSGFRNNLWSMITGWYKVGG